MGLAIFFIMATISVVTGLGVIFNKNVVYSALLLLINFSSMAILYFMLNAQFLGIVQILVYAGAIVVLFLFVVMLLGEQLGEEVSTWITPRNGVMALLGLILLTIVGTAVFGEETGINGQKGNFDIELVAQYGQSQLIGGILFTDYFLSVQLAGILLLVGVVGVIWLARKYEMPSSAAVTQHTTKETS